ncbi:MAG: anaerobic ribonucleoside-triphosphate reductase activating protein [Planctomycetaceae bacterium]|jgi:anaerobic ribonucleoside-triphosphate reductase activating protein|nr:anaerobic ribonucleoside-triphosphate reductase activating protein [Planctomycetaceae bacterium]
MSKIRIAGVVPESITDGPGVRFTIFTQGCPRRCPGCHNPQTHDPNGGYEIDADEILARIKNNPLLDGVTFSGGEPFLQASPLADLAQRLRELDLTVVTYTGYRYEELLAANRPDWLALLNETDILIDGPFMQEQTPATLLFRGSSNQRVIVLREVREKQPYSFI